ncbi:MAG: hypothetical protein GXY76_07285 [Chloroflexi bacterium]|nr:hypothetical protein [Chloroflexota bacterium]
MHTRLTLIALLVVVTLAWPVSGAATPALQQGGASLAGLLPPESVTSAGATLHEAELGSADLAYLSAGAANPGIYAARDYWNLSPSTYPVVGGHKSFFWDQLEPVEGQYDWNWIYNFINDQVALGRKAAFGISTYSGDNNGTWIGADGAKGLAVPNWFKTGSSFAIVTCSNGHQIPKYWHTRYLEKYGAFVAALAAEFDGNPNVAWIQIGTGKDGENQPSYERYDACLQGAGLDQFLWAETSFDITDLYVQAFNTTPVLFQFAPVYLGDWQRKDCSDYAVNNGAGLMHDGLVPDREKAYGSNTTCNNLAGHWDPIVTHNMQAPIAFESYQSYLSDGSGLLDNAKVYWAMLNGLAKHADYINLDKCLLNVCDAQSTLLLPLQPRTELFPIYRFTNQYLGKTVQNTPSVWVALRETELAYCPDAGNFSFWLTQDNDAASGRTVAVWNVGTAVEGRYTRRTDQATGNRYMYFDIADAYIYDNVPQVEIKVTYYDLGTDRWRLQYHAQSDIYKTAGEVAKTDSRTWKTETFTITDGKFANWQTGGNDFRIDSNGDGDEYIHLVDVRKLQAAPVQLSLSTGYNLISLPLVPSDTALTSVLAGIQGSYTKVFGFTNGQWKQYIVGAPPFVNTLTDLTEEMGYWLYMSGPATLNVAGTAPIATQVQLRAGSNLVGYPSSTPRSVPDALASIAGKYTKVYGYIGGQWKQYIVGAPPFVNSLTQLESGHGYWIYTSEACTLTITN